jgi:hypothetical protein
VLFTILIARHWQARDGLWDLEVCDEEKTAFSCWGAYMVKKRRKSMRPDRDDSWKP